MAKGTGSLQTHLSVTKFVYTSQCLYTWLRHPRLRMHVYAHIPSARVHNARRPCWRIYMPRYEGPKCIHPIISASACWILPPLQSLAFPHPLEPVLESGSVQPTVSSPSIPPTQRSPWSTAHLHGMHSYEIDHSSSDFLRRPVYPLLPARICSSQRYACAREIYPDEGTREMYVRLLVENWFR